MASFTGLAAMMAIASAAGDAQAPNQPIRLEIDQTGDQVKLNVVGDAREAVEARYTLEVASDGGGGVNRTSQSGYANLKPGTPPAKLIALSLSTRAMKGWQAKLTVQPVGGAPYTVARDYAAQ